MNTLEQLRIVPYWVNPAHLVSTAAHIMRGHRVRALGVLEGDVLIGTVALEDLAGVPESIAVRAVMRPIDAVAYLSDSVRDIAQRFVQEHLEFLPVIDGERFAGMVTPNMLLRELGRSFDPMSTLSWSDQLRDWGLEHLKRGDEVTILFIDLNDFGQYNKKFGHIVGDKVIREFAAALQGLIDPTRDVLVRYGGDEFAIGTLRLRDEAETLAELIRTRVSGLIVDEGVDPVHFSVGVFGGRRSKERENTHYAATLDNLINMASRACLAAKGAAKRDPVRAVVSMGDRPAEDNSPTYRIVGVYADDQGTKPVTTVILSHHDSVVSGAAPHRDANPLEAVALATAKAIERTLPDVALRVDEVSVADGEVRLVGKLLRGDQATSVSVTRRVIGDPLLAAAEVTLDAIVGVRN